MNRILILDLKSIKDVHLALYRELKEWFGLPPRLANDCYRMPLQMPIPGGIILGGVGD
jgi:hypothetical protein